MRRYLLSQAAERDIIDILTWSEENFGVAVRRRYQRLVVAAMRDVAANPQLLGSRDRPELADGVRTYHLRYSRDRIEGQTIRRPRHFLVYRVHADGNLEIGRVLHDSRDLELHLPPEYQTPESSKGEGT